MEAPQRFAPRQGGDSREESVPFLHLPERLDVSRRSPYHNIVTVAHPNSGKMSQSKEAMKRIYASLMLAELAWRDDLEAEKPAMAKTFSEINFNTKPKGYAVFVWSMKPDKCDFDRLIWFGAPPHASKRKPSRCLPEKTPFRLGQENERFNASEGVRFFDSAHEAYAFAYTKKSELEENHLRIRIQKDQKAMYRVYCHELESTAWSKSAFKKQQHREARNQGERHPAPIYYVGQTKLSPSLERARNHCNPDHKHSTKWGLEHFKGRQSKDELKHWHRESLKMVQRFHESTAQPIENLTYGQSLLVEAQLAQWLKDQGYPAYFA